MGKTHGWQSVGVLLRGRRLFLRARLEHRGCETDMEHRKNRHILLEYPTVRSYNVREMIDAVVQLRDETFQPMGTVCARRRSGCENQMLVASFYDGTAGYPDFGSAGQSQGRPWVMTIFPISTKLKKSGSSLIMDGFKLIGRGLLAAVGESGLFIQQDRPNRDRLESSPISPLGGPIGGNTDRLALIMYDRRIDSIRNKVVHYG